MSELPFRAKVLRFFKPSWFKEHVPEPTNLLLRCECGELMWMKSPSEVMAYHAGHGWKKPAIGGTWQELVAVNRGQIR